MLLILIGLCILGEGDIHRSWSMRSYTVTVTVTVTVAGMGKSS